MSLSGNNDLAFEDKFALIMSTHRGIYIGIAGKSCSVVIVAKHAGVNPEDCGFIWY